MKRRAFLGAAAATIFAPTFGRWYRRGSGLVVPEAMPTLLTLTDVQGEMLMVGTHFTAVEVDLDQIVAHGVNAKGEPLQTVMRVKSTIGFRPGQTIVLRGWPHQSQGRG